MSAFQPSRSSVLLVLALVAVGCGHTVRETWSPVPWLQMKWTHREEVGLTFNPGVLPGVGATSEGAFSETRVRVDGKWRTVAWSAHFEVYVLARGHGVLVPPYGGVGPSVIWVENRTEPAARLEGCVPHVRQGAGRVVCASCEPNEPCRRIIVTELDAQGGNVAHYGADFDVRDYWTVEGSTASGVLLRGGARSCRSNDGDDGSLVCRNVRCQVADLRPDGLHVIARADTCDAGWFSIELQRLRTPDCAPTVRTAE